MTDVTEDRDQAGLELSGLSHLERAPSPQLDITPLMPGPLPTSEDANSTKSEAFTPRRRGSLPVRPRHTRHTARRSRHGGLAGTAGFAQHQAARQQPQAHAGVALDGGEQVLARGAAQLAQVHVDRGQGRPAEVAMTSQLSKPTRATSSGTRSPASRTASATPRAIWSLPQKMASRPGAERSSTSAACRPHSSDHSPNSGSPSASSRPAAASASPRPGAQPGGLEPAGSGDVADARAARAQQVADGERAAILVVGNQREVRRIAGMGHRVHDGHRQVPADGLARVLAAPGHDDAVHPALQQRPQVMLFRIRSSRLSHRKTEIRPGPSASSAPCMTGMLNRPKLSVVIRPTVKLRPVSRPRASALGW